MASKNCKQWYSKVKEVRVNKQYRFKAVELFFKSAEKAFESLIDKLKAF